MSSRERLGVAQLLKQLCQEIRSFKIQITEEALRAHKKKMPFRLFAQFLWYLR